MDSSEIERFTDTVDEKIDGWTAIEKCVTAGPVVGQHFLSRLVQRHQAGFTKLSAFKS